MYGWKSDNEKDIESVLQQQTAFTQNHFERRCNQIIVEFAQQVPIFRKYRYFEIDLFFQGIECSTLL